MSFRKGDLFVVVLCLVAGGFALASVVSMQSTVGAYHWAAARVDYYLSAPERADQLSARVAACEAVLAVAQDDLKSAREQLLAEEQRGRRVLAAAEAKTAFVEAERDRMFSELAGLKARHSRLCQVLLELGNDVPSVLAAE